MLDCSRRLGMVARPGGKLAIAQGAQLTTQRLPYDNIIIEAGEASVSFATAECPATP